MDKRDKEVNNFPSDFVSIPEKETKEWGLKAAKAIHGIGYRKFIGQQDSNRNKFKLFRRYAAGTEPTEKFKKQVQGDGNTAELNLIYEVDSPLPTFVENIVGQLQNQDYKPRIRAISPETITAYDTKRDELKAKRMLARKADELKQVGVDVNKYVKKDEIFETDEEIEIHLELTFKDDLSLALEIATQFVLKSNKYPTLERKLIRDLVVCGRCHLKVDYDSDLDIIVRYVDPVNFISDEVENEDFSDSKWQAEYRYIELDTLAVLAQGQLDEEQLFEVAQANKDQRGNSWNNAWGSKYYESLTTAGRPWGNFKVEVLEYELKSNDKIKMESFTDKRSGGKLYKPANKKKRQADSTVDEVKVENIYKGQYLTGTENLINFGIKKNMPVDKQGNFYFANKEFSFVSYAPDIYDMINKSIVQKLIAASDRFKLLILHQQRIIAEAHPAGVAVDVAAVAGLANGFGEKNLRPRDFINIFRKTGTFLYTSQVNGKPLNNPAPIRDIPESSLVALSQLQAEKASIVAEMEQITGVPYSTIGTPDKEMLVGTAKMSSMNRNNALRYLNTAFKAVLTSATKQICKRVQDRIEDGKDLEDYGMAIGYGHVDTIKIAKGIPLVDLGIEISTAPDADEQQALFQILNQSLSRGTIKPSDAATVMRMAKDNVILAEKYLKVWESKYMKEEREKALENSQAQSQAQEVAGINIEKAKQQTMMIKYKLEMEKLQLEYKLKGIESTQDHREDVNLELVKTDGKKEVIETAIELEQQAAQGMEVEKEENVGGLSGSISKYAGGQPDTGVNVTPSRIGRRDMP